MRVEVPVFMLIMRTKLPVPSHPPFMKAGFEKIGMEGEAAEYSTCVIQTEGLVIRHLEKKKEKLGVTSQWQPPCQFGPYKLRSHLPRGRIQMMDGNVAPQTRYAFRLLLKSHWGSWGTRIYHRAGRNGSLGQRRKDGGELKRDRIAGRPRRGGRGKAGEVLRRIILGRM